MFIAFEMVIPDTVKIPGLESFVGLLFPFHVFSVDQTHRSEPVLLASILPLEAKCAIVRSEPLSAAAFRMRSAGFASSRCVADMLPSATF
jgi:hypothetical protein